MRLPHCGEKRSMKKLKYCFDTHAIAWYFTGQKTLSSRAKKLLDQVFSQDATAFISSIVLLETFHLSLKKETFIFSQFLKVIRLPNIIIVPLDKVVLSKCFLLPKNLEIHDQVIAATALVNGCLLVTKDPEMKRIPNLKTIW